MSKINFFTEDIQFNLPQKKSIKQWIKAVVQNERFVLDELNIIFCSDVYLLEINRQYLSHDYYTDIITFNNSELTTHIEGDIFISIDRVRENALSHQASFIQELYRVIIHGVLHLVGYNDHSPSDVLLMRQKEDSYLSLLHQSLS